MSIAYTTYEVCNGSVLIAEVDTLNHARNVYSRVATRRDYNTAYGLEITRVDHLRQRDKYGDRIKVRSSIAA